MAGPLAAMNAVLAIIVDSERKIIVINREAVQIIIFSFRILILTKPFNDGLNQPLAKRLPELRYFHPSKPCHWRGKRLHHGGDVCVLVFS